MGIGTKKRRNTPPTARDALVGLAEGVVQRVPNLAPEMTQAIAKALHDLLDGHDDLSRNMRIGMQHYLIGVAELQRGALPKPSDAMLTTEAAAELMQCSRPYVAMLIDNNKLAGASVTEGGHRRVPESSVRQWIKGREATAPGPDYHAVAEANGMYDIAETAFIQANKRRRP